MRLKRLLLIELILAITLIHIPATVKTIQG